MPQRATRQRAADDPHEPDARRKRSAKGPRKQDAQDGTREQYERARNLGTRGDRGFDPERDRYAEPLDRRYRRADRQARRSITRRGRKDGAASKTK